MTTDELIEALVSDVARSPPKPSHLVGLASVAAVIVAAVGFFAFVGLRPDVAVAILTWRFDFKFALTLLAAGTFLNCFHRSLQPGRRSGLAETMLAAAPLLLLAGALVELATLPSATWAMTAVGKNSMQCLTIIPALGAVPLGAMMLAARGGAPTRPAFTGMLAGLAAGSIAATFYAANCTDDSPLFVLAWYPLAIGALGLSGMAIGPLILKW
ncbi:MAG: NrsF family protein [Geminicoccaceae bacterium]